jgi:hypothetical protein
MQTLQAFDMERMLNLKIAIYLTRWIDKLKTNKIRIWIWKNNYSAENQQNKNWQNTEEGIQI